MFGYTDAAEALARCGARVDNVVFAAALGRLADVGGYFDDDEPLFHSTAAGAARWGGYDEIAALLAAAGA